MKWTDNSSLLNSRLYYIQCIFMLTAESQLQETIFYKSGSQSVGHNPWWGIK